MYGNIKDIHGENTGKNTGIFRKKWPHSEIFVEKVFGDTLLYICDPVINVSVYTKLKLSSVN